MEIKTTKDTFLFPIIFYFTDFLIILFTGYLIDLPIVGRKKPSLIFSVLASVAYIAKFLILKGQGEGVSFFWLDYTIRLCVSISFNILIEYNLEIYSTDIRATAFNINKLFSRVGDFTLPLILASNRIVATAIMGGLFLFMSIFLLKLKETRGEKLRETVEDSHKWEMEEKNSENSENPKNSEKTRKDNLSVDKGEEETKDLIEDRKQANQKNDGEYKKEKDV